MDDWFDSLQNNIAHVWHLFGLDYSKCECALNERFKIPSIKHLHDYSGLARLDDIDSVAEGLARRGSSVFYNWRSPRHLHNAMPCVCAQGVHT